MNHDVSIRKLFESRRRLRGRGTMSVTWYHFKTLQEGGLKATGSMASRSATCLWAFAACSWKASPCVGTRQELRFTARWVRISPRGVFSTKFGVETGKMNIATQRNRFCAKRRTEWTKRRPVWTRMGWSTAGCPICLSIAVCSYLSVCLSVCLPVCLARPPARLSSSRDPWWWSTKDPSLLITSWDARLRDVTLSCGTLCAHCPAPGNRRQPDGGRPGALRGASARQASDRITYLLLWVCRRVSWTWRKYSCCLFVRVASATCLLVRSVRHTCQAADKDEDKQ